CRPTSTSLSHARLLGLASLHINLHAFFFFTLPASTALSPLSLHDALPIYALGRTPRASCCISGPARTPSQSPGSSPPVPSPGTRSEEHTSELQSRSDLVCRLLLEKKKIKIKSP